MSDSFGKVVAILILATLMFIVPIVLYINIQKNTEQTYIICEIQEFVNEVENTGVITEDRYLFFCNELSKLSSIYSMEMTCVKIEIDENENIINEIVYDDEIKSKIKIDKKYNMKISDFFKVNIKKDGKIICFCGGGIKNEAY